MSTSHAPATGPAGNVYDKQASRHPLEKRLVDGFAATLASMCPPTISRVLEVGCGEGHQLALVTKSCAVGLAVGLDLSTDILEYYDVPEAPGIVGDVCRLPFPDGAFDVVLAIEMLEHVDDPDAAMREIARVSSGLVIASVPREPLWRIGNLLRRRYVAELGNTPGHIQHFSARSFVRLCSRHLDLDAVETPLPWTFVRGRVRS